MNEALTRRAANPAHLRVTVGVRAPADRVFSVLYDVERWPEWTPTMTSAKKIVAGPLVVGSKVRVRQPNLPPAVWVVTELDVDRRFTWITRSPGVRVAGGHYIENIAGGSQVTLTIDFSGPFGPLVSRFLRNLNRRYITTEAKGLKERCEAG